jgi:hypothetical protein
MKRAMWISATVLLLVAVSARAQDAKKAAFEWKTSGDTVETFKAECVLASPIDQSTPEGVVNGYTLLTDNRSEHREASDAIGKKAEELVAKAVKPLYDKLLGEELAKSREAAIAESSKESSKGSYKSEATTITSVTDGKDGAKIVETSQKGSYSSEEWDYEKGEPTGKMVETPWENKSRYTVIKGEDGKWRINVIEMLQKNWDKADDMGEAPEEWMPSQSALIWLMQEQPETKPAELKQDTPENTAQSLFNSVFASADNYQNKVFASAKQSWIGLLKPLHTEAAMTPPKDEDGAKFATAERSHEVDKVTDGSEGVKVVKFKATSEWSGAIEIHVKKTGDVWKIVKAGYYDVKWDDMGEMSEGDFVEVTNLEQLRWR